MSTVATAVPPLVNTRMARIERGRARNVIFAADRDRGSAIRGGNSDGPQVDSLPPDRSSPPRRPCHRTGQPPIPRRPWFRRAPRTTAGRARAATGAAAALRHRLPRIRRRRRCRHVRLRRRRAARRPGAAAAARSAASRPDRAAGAVTSRADRAATRCPPATRRPPVPAGAAIARDARARRAAAAAACRAAVPPPVEVSSLAAQGGYRDAATPIAASRNLTSAPRRPSPPPGRPTPVRPCTCTSVRSWRRSRCWCRRCW